jgi:CDP-2,3-bis-(O-geranylgeranyl)-sn-glycerol synthase
MLPVYTANNCATLLGGGFPIDGDRDFIDGRRILGDHKTYRGFILGTLCGIAMGAIQAIAVPVVAPYLAHVVGNTAFLSLPPAVIVALPLGALAGDSIKSFFKRRLGMPSGSMLPVADQLDFVLGAWVFCLMADTAWFVDSFTIPVVVVVIILTFPLQLFHNAVAVGLGKKKVLW